MYYAKSINITNGATNNASPIESEFRAINTAIDSLYADLPNVGGKAKLTSLAYANYKGEWSVLTGPMNTPTSVLHNDVIWQLVTDIPDITASEPGVSSDWISAYDHDTEARIAQIDPSMVGAAEIAFDSEYDYYVITGNRHLAISETWGYLTMRFIRGTEIAANYYYQVFKNGTQIYSGLPSSSVKMGVASYGNAISFEMRLSNISGSKKLFEFNAINTSGELYYGFGMNTETNKIGGIKFTDTSNSIGPFKVYGVKS